MKTTTEKWSKEEIDENRRCDIEEKKQPSPLCIERAAQAWCTPETSSIEMNTDLAYAFAKILDDIWSKPWLGNATTRELLDELKTRVDLDYKTNDTTKRR